MLPPVALGSGVICPYTSAPLGGARSPFACCLLTVPAAAALSALFRSRRLEGFTADETEESVAAVRRLMHMGAKGWGLVAAAPIPAEALVAQYTGEVRL